MPRPTADISGNDFSWFTGRDLVARRALQIIPNPKTAMFISISFDPDGMRDNRAQWHFSAGSGVFGNDFRAVYQCVTGRATSDQSESAFSSAFRMTVTSASTPVQYSLLPADGRRGTGTI